MDEKLNLALNKLDRQSREIIELYCGFNNKERKSQDELAEIFNITRRKVSNIINETKTFLLSHVDSLDPSLFTPNNYNKKLKYSLLAEKYGEENVLNAINSLNDKEKQIATMYFGLYNTEPMSHKEICKLLNINYSSKTLSNAMNKVENMLDPKVKETKLDILINKYGKEKVLDAINNLGEKSKKILILFFGLDGNEPMSHKEIKAKFNMINPSSAINYSLNRVEKIINNKVITKKTLFSKERLDNLIKEHGKQKVCEEINKLPLKEKQLLNLYLKLYNSNNSHKIFEEIRNITNIDDSSKIIYSELKKIEKKLNPNDLYNSKIKQIEKRFKRIEELEEIYGKETLNDAFNILNDTCKKIVYLRLGLNKNKPLSYKEIDKELNIKGSGQWFSYSIKRIEKHLTNSSKTASNKKQSFEELKTKYGIEQILEALDKAGNPIKQTVFMYYGLNGESSKTYKEINDTLGIKNSFNIINYLPNTLERIIEKRSSQREQILNLIKEYGKENVIEYINELKNPSRQILELLLGLNNNSPLNYKEINKELNITNSPSLINQEIKKMSILLEKQRNEGFNKSHLFKKRKMLFKKLIKSTSTKKITLAFTNLSEEESNIINLYFGLNGKDILTSNEMCQTFNMDRQTMESKIKAIINNINIFVLNSRKK